MKHNHGIVVFKKLINRDIMGKMKGNTFKLVMTLVKIWDDRGNPETLSLARKTIKYEARLSGDSAFTRAMEEAESLGIVERSKSNNPAKASEYRIPLAWATIAQNGTTTIAQNGTTTIAQNGPLISLEYSLIHTESDSEEGLGNEEATFSDWIRRYGKEVGRHTAHKAWHRLKPEERERCLAVVDAFVQATPDPMYRPNPTKYLNERRWEDEIESKPDPWEGIPIEPGSQDEAILHEILRKRNEGAP